MVETTEIRQEQALLQPAPPVSKSPQDEDNKQTTSPLISLVASDYSQKSLLERLGLSSIDKVFYPYLNEERDVVFVHWAFFLSFLMIPQAINLIFNFSWLMAAVYMACYFRFLGCYILMLHCTTHSPLFKKQYWYLNQYNSLFLGMFFGLSPDTYFLHHIKMHHVEGNGLNDLSCTLDYQRDSLVDFLKYFGRFFVFGVVELSLYFIKKGLYAFAIRGVVGELVYHAIGWTILSHSRGAGFLLYLLLVTVTRLGMMSGNWVQHAFIDASDPMSDYKSSITCINTPYNAWCFNDGYHTSHHLHPHRHWTEHPGHLIAKESVYQKNGAIVFKGLDYHMIFVILMAGRFNLLAKYVVQMGGDNKTEQQIADMLKERVKRLDITKLKQQ